MTVRILQGDCREVLKTLADDSVDACVTDPPYGIGFMGKQWDTFKPGTARQAERMVKGEPIVSDNPNVNGRRRAPAISPSQIAYDESRDGRLRFQLWTEEWARQVYRVLKPGGHLLCSGAPRSYHRMACGIEDAGFEVRDCVLWLFGQGFPKSLNVCKAIDRELGEPQPVSGIGDAVDRTALDTGGGTGKAKNGLKSEFIKTAPNTAHASQWQGWGTALKPAWEPVLLARKPLIGTVAENVLKHGTGALNIDGCRIDAASGSGVWGSSNRSCQDGRMFNASPDGEDFRSQQHPKGRWPANVIHDGSGCVVSGFPIEAGAAAPVHRRNGDKFVTLYGAFKGDVDEEGSTFHGDTGSAARFFYVPKADRADRDDGLAGFDKKPILWSSGEQSPGTFQSPNTERAARNFHPTVKPTDLMRYLCELVTPPGGVILDPFLGSGSTGRGAVIGGFDFIGIEKEDKYIEIARARIRACAPLFVGDTE